MQNEEQCHDSNHLKCHGNLASGFHNEKLVATKLPTKSEILSVFFMSMVESRTLRQNASII